jgi:Uma2 family endonuclease
MSNIKNLGELADAAKGAADRAAKSIDDSLSCVEKSNLRIAALEKVPLQKKTLTEFLAWEGHQTERHEFLGGKTYAMGGGTARHNRVVLNLASRIGHHLDGTLCQVFAQNMKVKIAEGMLYPDVMVTCGKAEAGNEQTVSDPGLIIEVLSPGSGGYDKRDKFIVYRALPSLREYVLIDSMKRQVEVFTLAGGGSWVSTEQTGSVDLSLTSIDCKLPMELVFKGVEKDYSMTTETIGHTTLENLVKEVQEAIDDPRPSLTQDQVSAEWMIERAALAKQVKNAD